MTLFSLIQHYFTFDGNLNTMQTQTWKTICDKIEKDPKSVTLLEMFQVSKIMERARLGSLANGFTQNAIKIKDIQERIKISLSM